MKALPLRISTHSVNTSRWFILSIILVSLIMPFAAYSQQENLSVIRELKKLSVEELMNIEVISVSKRPEKLAEVASAIQVITNEDIQRSSATNLPEALRLAPNLQVAQINSHAWVISARGFNTVFSNKLLVMIDGRTVYSPLFAGVYWDAQSVLLEDVDRIEIISGPGGTLWGSNAVNGVINIITKKSQDTNGLYVSGAVGTYLRGLGAIRYGGNIGTKISYRVFTQANWRNNTVLPDGKDNTDNWRFIHNGFRMDWNPSEKNTIALQGNFYNGNEQTSPSQSTFDGQNALVRWAHTFSPKSDLIIQAYYDRTWRRDIPSTFSDELDTYDLDVQHHFSFGKRNNILWGLGYRNMEDKSQHSTDFVGFIPMSRNMELFSSFLQDEFTVIPDKVTLTVGTKLLHNVFSGFEVQPSGRLAWTLKARHTIWGAVSRAVRTPSRIDVDYYIPTYTVPVGTQNVAGGPNFISEKVIAYELGYRVQPTTKSSLSLATFYNQYSDLYSVEALPGTLTYQIQNGTEGYSYGAELSGIYQIFPIWRLRGGYTYFDKKITNKPGHNFDTSYAGSDPQNQYVIQSTVDLPAHFQIDVTGRFVDTRPESFVSGLSRTPSYFCFNVHIAWNYKFLEIAVVAQNLSKDHYTEFGSTPVPRNFYGKLTWRF